MMNLVKEFVVFIRFSKKYWLLPIIFILLMVAAFIFLAESTISAPFIYALF